MEQPGHSGHGIEASDRTPERSTEVDHRCLLRGRRWANRRVILVSALGCVALVVLQITPYPAWMRVEQLLQAVVLLALLYFVTRPEVRSHFASGLPGRDVRRFGRR